MCVHWRRFCKPTLPKWRCIGVVFDFNDLHTGPLSLCILFGHVFSCLCAAVVAFRTHLCVNHVCCYVLIRADCLNSPVCAYHLAQQLMYCLSFKSHYTNDLMRCWCPCTCVHVLMCSVFELIACLIAGYCCLVLVCELAVHTCYRLRSTLLSSKRYMKIDVSDVLSCVVCWLGDETGRHATTTPNSAKWDLRQWAK